MWVIATVGEAAGSYQALRYDSMAHCERDRPLIETSMKFSGYRGIVTVCKVSQEKSS